MDSGVAMDHADLAPNIWANPGESGGGLETNATDDDGNMKIDDHRGWDFVDEDNDPTDEDGHGSHVAGMIGAKGDNSKGSPASTGSRAAAAAGVRRLRRLRQLRRRRRVRLRGPAGSGGRQREHLGERLLVAQQGAIATLPGTLFVVAAGNDNGNNNDVSSRFPCNHPGANVICVGATTSLDTLASYSNFGSTSVDLAAPGGSGGTPVTSAYLSEPMLQNFDNPPLDADWETGGTPDTWDRTTEASELPGATLTDSPGTDHGDNVDSFARYGPMDLSADSGCRLRYTLALDLPDPDDRLFVQNSTDDVTYGTVQEWTGVGKITPTPLTPDVSGASTAYVRFKLVTDGDGPSGDGAHIDNVRIRCPSTAYRGLQGTSMAAPHVSGAAALLLDVAPGATVAELREWLLDGVDLKSSLEGRVVSNGRLNLARSVSGALGADIDRPETSIVGGPEPSSKSTSATFSFEADEPSTFSCSHNGAAFTPCTTPQPLSGLAIGVHTFKVRATDLAGNDESTPASYSFTVEGPDQADPCAALRKKLKRAKGQKQKRKLRKKIKRRCGKGS